MCNMDMGTNGHCEDCENIDDCVNEGFMHENGVQECLKICEGVTSTSYTQTSTTTTTTTELVFEEGPARFPAADRCLNPLMGGPMGRKRRSQKSPKIVGGAAAKAQNWEFIAKVQVKIANSDAFVTCGGTILSYSHILTAGHCCKVAKDQDAGMNVEIGQYNSNLEDEH